jgi:hypothetical protein
MGDPQSARHNTFPGVALRTPSHSVHLRCATSGFLCIDTFEICGHHLNPQLEPEYDGECRAPLRAVVHPIYSSYYDSYA